MRYLPLKAPDGEAHDLADALAALVGEEPEATGDRHVMLRVFGG
jgi:hypothetical protein